MELKSTDWLKLLLDVNSFIPIQTHTTGLRASIDDNNAVTTGLGKVIGRQVAIYAQNTEINRGYMDEKACEKILFLMEKAATLKIPIIALLASPGIDIENDLASGIGYTKIIRKNIAFSGEIPQFAVIMGPTLGAPAYSSVLMDLRFFSQHRSYLMVTSPAVIKEAIGEKTNLLEIGSPDVHGRQTGIADYLNASTQEQLEQVKHILNFFPQSYKSLPNLKKVTPPTMAVPDIPDAPHIPFDIRRLVEALTDASIIYEYKANFGRSMLCAFAHLGGFPVGLMANNSKYLSGAINCEAAEKSTKFLRLCDAYNIPIITLIDVPGFMPGKREEQNGLLKYGAGFCFAMQTQVARLSVIVRKAYGAAAFLMMQTKAQGGDLVLALEKAQIGVMGKNSIASVKSAEHDGRYNAEYHSQSVKLAQEKGLIDEIVQSNEIRERLIYHLSTLFYKSQSGISLNKRPIYP